MTFKHMFGRHKDSGTEYKAKVGKPSTNGAHELFLEYEGFLSPPTSRRQQPSTTTAKPAHALTSAQKHGSKRGSVIYTPRSTETHCDIPPRSSHDLRNLVDENPFQHKRTPSRHKKGLFSLSRPSHSKAKDAPAKPLDLAPSRGSEPRSADRTPHSGWLRKCMSTSSQGHQPSLGPSLTTLPPYYEFPVFDDENLTALPSLPGYENESPRPSEKPVSGAAARAAAAAQNEVIDSMRNLRLAEPKLTRDSESGVGIEVRDRGEAITDLDVPVIRRGKKPKSIRKDLLTGSHCRSAQCTA